MAPLFTPSFSPTESYNLYNIGVTTSVAANALTINLVASDGSTTLSTGKPGYIAMRSATLTSGSFNLRSVTGALSLTVPSSATLGMANGVSGILCFYAIDNAGTIEPAIRFAPLAEQTGIVTTTTISGSATSNAVMYSTTGRASVAFRLIALITISEATAGTWASNATQISLVTPYTRLPFIGIKYGGTAQTLNSAAATIVYTTKNFDTHNCYTSSGFTVPTAGLYQVSANASITGTFTSVNNQAFIASQLNGTNTIISNQIVNQNWTQQTPVISDTMNCAVGDVIRIQGSATNAASASYVNDITQTNFSVFWVGA